MARRLGIKPQAIYQWGGKIPELRQFQIDQVITSELCGSGSNSEDNQAA